MKRNWQQILLAIIGVILIALALSATSMGWTGFESLGMNHVLLIVFGVLLLGVGGLRERFPAKQIGAAYQSVAALLLTVVVVFLALELLSVISINIKNNLFFRGRIIVGDNDVRRDLPYYQSQTWGDQYWKEHHEHHTQYYPYVLWRDAEFKGETINVNADGIRLTPGADCGDKSLKVFAFGGSTMWGDGSPDWGTIPAYLQTVLAQDSSQPVCVVNFGEQAFVSTQSIIQLMMELQRNHIPNVVIFYDGINDVEAAYQSGQAGIHQNLAQFLANLQPNTLNEAIQQTVQSSYTYTLMSGLLRGQSKAKLLTYESMGVDAGKLADDVTQVYLGNRQIVDALAQEYGFKYAFFWQPALAVNTKPLTDQEQAIQVSIDPALQTLYNAVYQRVQDAAANTPHLYDFANALDESHDSLWIDYYHITPVGNEIIAGKMLEVMRDTR